MTLNPLPAKQAAAKAYNAFNLAAFTVGTKLTNTINVAVQLQNAHGVSLAQIAGVKAYLSDNANGSTLTATVPTSTLAIGTNGVIIGVLTTNKAVEIITNALGQFDLNVIQTVGGTNYYLVVEMPDGSIVVSPVIGF